jgi:nitroimidazol reductase NimA-like FMN-containing flavoprotein (pyridoxamine 5'-phosphate oxidase superfamily)
MTRADFEPTPATTLHRRPERGSYDRDLVYAILDEALIAHVGMALDGQPVVLPMVFGRDGDRLVLHGSVANRLLRALDDGLPVCVTVTLLDGLVLAHAQFSHSVNYRSVVVLGTARRLRGDAAAAALTRVIDHAVPGRSTEARPPNAAELRETTVLELPIEEASAKVRSGPPVEPHEQDRDLDVWVGVLPLAVVAGSPVPDERGPRAALPASITPWRRPNRSRAV